MTNQFSDLQLAHALTEAARQDEISISGGEGCAHWYGRELDELRRILEALPASEPEVWENCLHSELRKGDRLAYEVDGRRVELGEPIVSVEVFYGRLNVETKNYEGSILIAGTVFYRLPAPVVTPDPAEHQYIAITEFKNSGPFYPAKAAHADQWGNAYIVAGWGPAAAEDITEWKPLGVAGE